MVLATHMQDFFSFSEEIRNKSVSYLETILANVLIFLNQFVDSDMLNVGSDLKMYEMFTYKASEETLNMDCIRRSKFIYPLGSSRYLLVQGAINTCTYENMHTRCR